VVLVLQDRLLRAIVDIATQHAANNLLAGETPVSMQVNGDVWCLGGIRLATSKCRERAGQGQS
jgi:hypothetical protein